MARTGRPKIDNARYKRVTLRFSDEEYARIVAEAQRKDSTLTQVILTAINEYFKKP